MPLPPRPPRDPARIDPLLAEVRRAWMEYPDLRLGQLIKCCIRDSGPCPRVFYCEDDQLLAGLRDRFPPPAPDKAPPDVP